ncbi:MAG: hypothetical protein IJP13_04690 [Lachnospiraceae bacterium]|nr:hypothetical protein [Lachnospiraceae bacterium]
MNREVKHLQKINEEKEKAVPEEYMESLTDMIVYIRWANISEYNQELIRSELIDKFIQCADQGITIEILYGKSSREICDEYIAKMPKRTAFQRVLEAVSISLNIVWILGAMSVLKGFILAIASDDKEFTYSLRLGEVITAVLIVIVANLTVRIICRTVLSKEEKPQRRMNTFLMWLGITVVMAIIILPTIFLTEVLVTTNLLIAAIVIAVTFTVQKIIAVSF